jgi:hypothetical protein
MEKNIKELSENFEHTKIYLIHIFNILNSFTRYTNTGAYESGIQGLENDFYFKELISGQWGLQYISDNTRYKCMMFYDMWRSYRESKLYGDSFFVYFDSEWYDLMETFLMP